MTNSSHLEPRRTGAPGLDPATLSKPNQGTLRGQSLLPVAQQVLSRNAATGVKESCFSPCCGELAEVKGGHKGIEQA